MCLETTTSLSLKLNQDETNFFQPGPTFNSYQDSNKTTNNHTETNNYNHTKTNNYNLSETNNYNYTKTYNYNH